MVDARGIIICAGLTLAAPLSAAGQGMPDSAPLLMPSGEMAYPLDEIWDESQSMIRLRFVVPKLAEPSSVYGGDPFRVFEDMMWLCSTQMRGLTDIGEFPQDQGWQGAIITMLERDIPFGTRDADVVQFFEGFVFGMDGCELEDDLYHD
ncbi:DUF6497 family protein [Roseinatronobacter sp. S2]|uniref:DUF6497 family protein n=1 Tax=Roseinatronobacter sp. S2 TaxID=3035471 RepID=UPI0024105990|nr:DUF6497 family protein [Roseinatronobacter sp. S2]WFE73527.1 DUF6497 family protein [Roseinatronobacter sp. S2]